MGMLFDIFYGRRFIVLLKENNSFFYSNKLLNKKGVCYV